MKNIIRFFLYTLFLMSLFSIPLLAQWTICPGSINLTGLGASPSVSVTSPTVIWVCGGSSNAPKVMRTTDGGNTFSNVTGNMVSTPELWCIWAVDQNTALVGDGGAPSGAGGNAKIWKTTNAGVNWNVILTTGGTAGFINSIVFSRTTPNFGVIQSDPPTGAGGTYLLWITSDFGANWTIWTAPGISGEVSAQRGLTVIDNHFFGFGLASNTPPRIRWTSNGGNNWNLASIGGMPGGFVSGLAIRSDKQVWICSTGDYGGGSLPNIARSEDGGATWSLVNTGAALYGYCTMRWVYNTNVCYLSGEVSATGCVKKSTDGGTTWNTQTTASVENFTSFDLYYSAPSVYAYAIAPNGSCVKLIDDLTGLEPKNTSIPTEYKLVQNYPNPFNPLTTIKYSLPKASQVTLKIYDVLGNEVKTVVDKFESAGNYIESFDGSELASGVYFYKLNAGDFTETKKMSLVR